MLRAGASSFSFLGFQAGEPPGAREVLLTAADAGDVLRRALRMPRVVHDADAAIAGDLDHVRAFDVAAVVQRLTRYDEEQLDHGFGAAAGVAVEVLAAGALARLEDLAQDPVLAQLVTDAHLLDQDVAVAQLVVDAIGLSRAGSGEQGGERKRSQ